MTNRYSRWPDIKKAPALQVPFERVTRLELATLSLGS